MDYEELMIMYDKLCKFAVRSSVDGLIFNVYIYDEHLALDINGETYLSRINSEDEGMNIIKSIKYGYNIGRKKRTSSLRLQS